MFGRRGGRENRKLVEGIKPELENGEEASRGIKTELGNGEEGEHFSLIVLYLVREQEAKKEIASLVWLRKKERNERF